VSDPSLFGEKCDGDFLILLPTIDSMEKPIFGFDAGCIVIIGAEGIISNIQVFFCGKFIKLFKILN
jgi:hypothetical protein